MPNLRASTTLLVCVVILSVLALSAQTPDVNALIPKAAAGDSTAQLALAQAYQKGQGVPQNDNLAAKWYLASAQQGNAEAQNSIAVLYRLGHGVDRDYTLAASWFQKSARQGYATAMFNLGVAYFNGDGIGGSDNHAYAWFMLAQRGGSKEAVDAVRRMEADFEARGEGGSPNRIDAAKFVLADLVLRGAEAPQDLPYGRQLLKEVADHKDQHAQFELGRMLAEGLGGEVDGNAAVRYLNASSLPEAKQYLAQMYLEGKCVPADVKKATDLLTRVADAFPATGSILADLYWSGDKIPQDYKRAAKYYDNAAGWGIPHALYRMSIAHRDGLGLSEDADKSCMYLMLALATGSSEAEVEGKSPCRPGDLDKVRSKTSSWLKTHPRAQFVIQERIRQLQKATQTPPAE